MLAFPGFFRGMLDSGAHEITDDCLLAAATAIADTVGPAELNANYIVPSYVRSARCPRRRRGNPESNHPAEDPRRLLIHACRFLRPPTTHGALMKTGFFLPNLGPPQPRTTLSTSHGRQRILA